MRLLSIIPLCALLGCSGEPPLDTPPLGRFYFPTGIVHVADASGPGRLFVASSNFDKRYDVGAVTAVDLSAIEGLALPSYLDPMSSITAPNDRPVQTGALPVEDAQQVYISPFAGIMDVFLTPEGSPRLFVPTRSEGDYVYVIDAQGTNLSCHGVADTRECLVAEGTSSSAALSLTAQGLAARDGEVDGFEQGKPRAPEPYAATVAQPDPSQPPLVYVTHLGQADSPVDSARNREAFLVKFSAAEPEITRDSFVPIGPASANSAVVGGRYIYVSGRRVGSLLPPALRLIDTRPGLEGQIVESQLQAAFRIVEARDLAISEDEQRVFLVGRSPDVLLVANVVGADTTVPQLRLVRSVPLPDNPDQIVLIPRGGARGALVAITCAGANSVALYDDEIGQLATVVSGVGEQPYGISVHRPAGATGARLYVTNFGDGQVAVIDIPDVDKAYIAKVVAKIGPSQRCLTEPGVPCEEAVQ